MIRKSLFILVALFSMGGYAQVWCPPGATWTYNSELITAGFMRMTYVGDTIIAGDTAQVIDRYTITQYPQPDPPYWSIPYDSYQPVAVIMKTVDEVVYTWNNTWDTLYWFGANIGDQWYPAHNSSPDCDPLVVSDTGSTVFDGVRLRWLFVGNERLHERIGPTMSMSLWCPNWMIDGPAGIRCYSDNEISVNFTSYGCETMAGLEEQRLAASSSLSPNPGTDHFSLSLSPGPHTVTLFDATGRMVHQERISDKRATINTAHLASGIYLVKVDEGWKPVRWVKE